jgi:lantibiotic modifying enzyme
MSSRRASPAEAAAKPAAPGADDLIEVAAGIGSRLTGEAIWHSDRCNWIGGTVVPGPFGSLIEHQKALDLTLYEGTAGVAFFLTELYTATGDPAVRRTALGAIGQALDAASASPPGRALYSGTAGIALTAARAGRALSEPGLVEAARGLAREIAAAPTAEDEELDLLNGTSGTLLGLLALSELLDEPELVAAAGRLGDGLLEAAEEDELGLSWGSRTMPTQHNLTGLSHGAAGIALALIELHRATGDARFARGAERAFDYEQSRFDSGARNWPDFRDLDPERPATGPGFATFWCHGGPGIALSRLTALEQLAGGGRRWRAEAATGLAVTEETVVRGLAHRADNFSLCHGIGGNAEILAEGARVLGGRWARGADLALETAAAGASWYGPTGTWPCGAGSRETPGLMLGLAGIGLFYLRMAGARVPSVLRPQANELAR